MMEGLAPLTDSAREFMNARFPGKQFNISMDYCMMLGDRDVISMGIIMVPITLGLAAILPGNHFLPFTDLPSLPYHMIGAVIGTRRNSFRALIVAVITLSLALWVATDMPLRRGRRFPDYAPDLSGLDICYINWYLLHFSLYQ